MHDAANGFTRQKRTKRAQHAAPLRERPRPALKLRGRRYDGRDKSRPYKSTLTNCLPGNCRTMPFISNSKSVASTSDEFSPEFSTNSST
jgi:hypothetical protein